jgi:RimJ/RimL family protein N-acetyltransferase
MNKWLLDVELSGDLVTLVPMRPHHNEVLIKAASDGKLWELWYTGVPSPNSVDEHIAFALSENEVDRALPFVVIENATNTVIGSTRYLNAKPNHRRLEIGNTWYSKRHQRTGVNTECKLLLLSHAFEQLNSIAVEFRTHWHNHASRNAISRLGAKQDGVLRNHQIDTDGIHRDTVVFSIIESEWPAVKKSLCFKLERNNQR